MEVSSTGQFFEDDPYLAYQPAFSYSLPIQLFVNGITVTLLCVLWIHVLFTTQYHYPLARLNYTLQFTSIVVVLISVVTKCAIMLNSCADSGDRWPYGLAYVAVTIPPTTWGKGKNVAWFLLQALNTGLPNITHIQFLTLLYPSRTEARLILFILGPLAIASSGLVFIALSGSQSVIDIGDSIRNVLNSTLLLLFAIALAIWGFLVNRRRAWRTDGGTAVFGFGALLLAGITTTFNFVAVAEDGIDWLPHLLYAAVLWQTWLGWWWWVGSGMGIGEVEDMMERAERKKRSAAKRAAAQRANSTSKVAGRKRSSSLADVGLASANAMAGFTSGVTSILRSRNSTLTRRNTARSQSQDIEEGVPSGEAIEMETIRPPTRSSQGQGRVEFTDVVDSRNLPSTNSETSSTSATPSIHMPHSVGQLLAFPTTWLQVYFRQLRRAHEEAARKQALLRAERRQQVFASSTERPVRDLSDDERAENDRARRATQRAHAEAAVVRGEGAGWGLGQFGIEEHRQGAARLQAVKDQLQSDRLLDPTTEGEAGPSGGPIQSSKEAGRVTEEEEWEDLDDTTSSGSGAGRNQGKDKRRERKKPPDRKEGTGTGWSWWGPLKDWRLSDRSTF